ncbi:unnamed protein product [Microthlaspi erraticum]|uniref:F-box domain-containing protein n=1 Tax=Microthlaspi erraticum TaxID=1685480 RepID=A0A6D2HR27_9BRAS|nr:unnamed protein product [Microthlaspi erraticum]
MKKADSWREDSDWETLHRDILAVIFAKLDVMDLTNGASRLCSSWFLASHNRTLWNTIDLGKLGKVKKGRSLRSIMNKIRTFLFNVNEERTSLTYITKFSHTAPKNLFFTSSSWTEDGDVLFAAERLPNIEKLALPRRLLESDKSLQLAFGKWKNLKTLIIAHNRYPLTKAFEFQVLGENCSNLTNLKYLGCLDEHIAEQMARYLQSIKRLSLQCSVVTTDEVLLLITNLRNLAVLNLSHCYGLDQESDMVLVYNLVQAASKLDKFITCSQGCTSCQEICSRSWVNKHWRNDEIKEFEF